MLKVKERFIYENNKPFFYLADTAWQLFNKIEEKDAVIYLKNRALLKYNVIQSILVLNCDGNNHFKTDEYWAYVKKLIRYGKTLGLYFSLLPCWGIVVKNNIVNESNAKEFAEFLASYFKNEENIIWVLGGDIRASDAIETYKILGKTLKENDSNHLISFHPFGRTGSYLWLNDCTWLDFNMFQSGHRRYDQLTLNAWDDLELNEDSFGEDNYKYVMKSKTYDIVKPILDGEPSYEGLVQGLHDIDEPYWEARHIRRYAYWSVFEGACGFTYGHSAIIQFYNGTGEKEYGVRDTWKKALAAPGASEMQYLKDLFVEYDFTNLNPLDIVLNQKERHHHISCIGNNKYILCYTYKGDLINLDLSKYQNKKFDAYWLNPENGSKAYFDTFVASNNASFRPIRRRELSNDWVLILEVNNE